MDGDGLQMFVESAIEVSRYDLVVSNRNKNHDTLSSLNSFVPLKAANL